MPQLPDGAESPAGLHNIMGQPDLKLQRAGEKSSHPLADSVDPELTEYAIDQVVGLRGTESWTEYKVRWYGYSAVNDTYRPSLELPINFVRRYRACRRRCSVPRFKKDWIEDSAAIKIEERSFIHVYLARPTEVPTNRCLSVLVFYPSDLNHLRLRD